MALSYEYSIGSVRAKEKSLLNSSDIDQMINCKTSDELCKFLNDKGYGSGDNISDIITNHTESVWNYLKSVAPDFTVFDIFLIINDAHNLKVVLKSIIADKRHDELLVYPSTIDKDVIKNAVEQRKFNLLPDWLSQNAEKAYQIIAHKSDAKECDALIDKAVMERMLELAQKHGSDFLNSYIKTNVFYNNIKIAVRSSRNGTDTDFLNNALCDVESFRKASVISAALKGIDYLIDELDKFSEYDCKKAIEQYKISPIAFEKYIDNKLIIMAKENCKRAGEGAEPIIGYYLGCEAEKKNIQIISGGIRTLTSTELIRERLREFYA